MGFHSTTSVQLHAARIVVYPKRSLKLLDGLTILRDSSSAYIAILFQLDLNHRILDRR